MGKVSHWNTVAISHNAGKILLRLRRVSCAHPRRTHNLTYGQSASNLSPVGTRAKHKIRAKPRFPPMRRQGLRVYFTFVTVHPLRQL